MAEQDASSRWCVVGGAGFIGSRLVHRLLAEDRAASVVVLDNLSSGSRELLGDLLEDPRLRLVVGDCGDPEVAAVALDGADVVVHLASNPDIARAVTEPEIDFTAGTLLTNSVIEAARRSGAGTFIYASGSGVYGDLGDLEIPEGYGPMTPVSTYGASKLAGEALVCAYAHMFGLRGRAFRFANVVGPNQTHGVGYDFLAKLAVDSSHLTILGDGRQSKCYIGVDDVLDAIDVVLDAADDRPYVVYNVSTDDALSVDDIAEAACAAVGLDPDDVTFEHTGGRGGWNGDVPVVRLDTSAIRSLGWAPRRTSSEAMTWALNSMQTGGDDVAVEGSIHRDDTAGPGAAERQEAPVPQPVVDPDQSEQMTQGEKRLLGGLAAAGIVVLLIVLALNLLGGETTEESSPEPSPEQIEDATVPADGAEAAFSGEGGLVPIPEEMAPLDEPITDNLERPDLDGGPFEWTVLGEGTWVPADGTIETGSEPADALPFAVVKVPTELGADWTFSAVSVEPGNDAGFVFGVVDADNYWELKFNRVFAAAELRHIQDGEPTTVKIVGPTSLGEGRTWSIEHSGDTVVMGSEEAPFLAVSDPSLEAPRMVGVIGSANDPTTFADIQVAPFENSG